MSKKSNIEEMIPWLLQAIKAVRPVPKEPEDYLSLQVCLYHLRKVSRLTLEEVASKLGIAPTTLASVESALKYSGVSVPVMERVRELAKTYALPKMVRYLDLLLIQTRMRTGPGNRSGRPKPVRVGDVKSLYGGN